jgi:hypothetical protein|tara:strand:+ start:4560 stop:5435 length:876 start_codon:yes stop_codon:yes gene_type:complete
MEINHAAELPIKMLMRDATLGKSEMSEAVMDNVASDVKDGLDKQFNGGPRGKFKLRMSNIGRPKCQLWFEKNRPEEKEPFPDQFMMNMMLGDIVEAVFKGILRTAKVVFQDNNFVSLDLGGGRRPIKGEYDLIMDGRVDDVKSASDYSYNHKFVDFETLQASDPFGYVAQLVGYAVAAGKKVGGWWVVNKANGQHKYVSAKHADVEAILDNIRETYDYLENDEPLERQYEDVPETYRKKTTGNRVLCRECNFCSFKKACWPEYLELPSRTYQGRKTPPTVAYTQLNLKEYL